MQWMSSPEGIAHTTRLTDARCISHAYKHENDLNTHDAYYISDIRPLSWLLYHVRYLQITVQETNLLLGHGRSGKRSDVKVNARLPHRRTRTARRGSNRRSWSPSQGTTRSIEVACRISSVQSVSDNTYDSIFIRPIDEEFLFLTLYCRHCSSACQFACQLDTDILSYSVTVTE